MLHGDMRIYAEVWIMTKGGEQIILTQLIELESKMREIGVMMMETGETQIMLHGEELMDAAWIVKDWIEWMKPESTYKQNKHEGANK
jgi:hypothetical protein